MAAGMANPDAPFGGNRRDFLCRLEVAIGRNRQHFCLRQAAHLILLSCYFGIGTAGLPDTIACAPKALSVQFRDSAGRIPSRLKKAIF
jgi:hypothetical protein